MIAGKWDHMKRRLHISRDELAGVQSAMSEPDRTHGERVIAALIAGGMDEDLAFLAALTSGLSREPITFVLRT